MSPVKTFQCVECGVGEVRPSTGRGRWGRYKTMALPIDDEILIPTCEQCGAEYIDDTTAKTLDTHLAIKYHAELGVRAAEAIATIRQHIPQYKLEQLLGLSHGYLSKLRREQQVPSSGLVGNLGLIALDPKRRLRELDAFWGGTSMQKDRRQLMEQAVDFLANADGMKLYPQESWQQSGVMQVVGEVIDAPNTRVLIYPDLEEALTGTSITNPVYVDANWLSALSVDLIVASFVGPTAITAAWESGLALACQRAKVKARLAENNKLAS